MNPVTPTLQELEILFRDAENILDKQPFLMDLDLPAATIVGDLHGSWDSYQKALQHREGALVFLGDIVDRGPYQIEILAEVLKLLVREDGNVFYLRGNHETKKVNSVWGFVDHLKERYGENGTYVWERVNEVFDKLPVCAVLNRTFFLVHGGVSQGYPKLGDIRRRGNAKKLNEDDQELLWNDPGETNQRKPFIPNEYRGVRKTFSQQIAEKFCTDSGLRAVVRGHRCVPQGIKWTDNKRVLTVYSIPRYRDNNLGGVAIVKKRNIVTHTYV